MALLWLGETGRNHVPQGCTAALVVLLHPDKLSKTSLCPGWDISVRYPKREVQGCRSECSWIYFRPQRFWLKDPLGACQRSRKGNRLGRLKVTHAWEPLASPQWPCCLKEPSAGSPGISSEHAGNASSVRGPAVPGHGGQGRAGCGSARVALRGQRRTLLRPRPGKSAAPAASSARLPPVASNLFCIWTGRLENRSAVFLSLYYMLAFQFCSLKSR